MKKILLSLFLLLPLTFTSCEKENKDDISDEIITLSVANLEKGTGQYYGFIDTKEYSLLTFSGNTMKVVDYKDPYKFNMGTYKYTITGSTIRLTNNEGESYSFSAELKEQAIDGITTTYLIIQGSNLPEYVVSVSYIKTTFEW